MATKKTAASSKKTAKKPVRKAPTKASKTTTKVTTVKAAPAASAKSKKVSLGNLPVLSASVAEFVGTFMLATIVLATNGTPLFVLFALVAIVLAIGAVSGAHVNPAITIGAWATRRVNSVRALSYLVAQSLGAVMAFLVVSAYINAAPEVSAQAAAFGQQAPTLFEFGELVKGKEWFLVAAELMGTALFAFAVASIMTKKAAGRVTSAFAVGGGLFVALTIGGYLVSVIGATGVALNPAVAGAVQALSWDVWPLAIFVVAPALGGVIGFALQDLLSSQTQEA